METVQVEDHYGLVRFVINRLRKCGLIPRHYPTEKDCFQAGVIGLCKSLKTFNPTLGKFSSYAYRGILQEVVNEISGGGLIHLSRPLYLASSRNYFGPSYRVTPTTLALAR